MKKQTKEILVIIALAIFMFFHWRHILKKFECDNVDCYRGPVQAEDDPTTGYGE